jgi:hypothetical protein
MYQRSGNIATSNKNCEASYIGNTSQSEKRAQRKCRLRDICHTVVFQLNRDSMPTALISTSTVSEQTST